MESRYRNNAELSIENLTFMSWKAQRYPFYSNASRIFKPHKDTTELGKLDENSHKVYIAQRLPLHGLLYCK